MLAYLQMALLDPVQYVPVTSTFLEGKALRHYRSLTARNPEVAFEWSAFADNREAAPDATASAA